MESSETNLELIVSYLYRPVRWWTAEGGTPNTRLRRVFLAIHRVWLAPLINTFELVGNGKENDPLLVSRIS
ncbi:hypothetical protein D9M72_329030 [compost metagenome]